MRLAGIKGAALATVALLGLELGLGLVLEWVLCLLQAKQFRLVFLLIVL